MEPKKGEKCFEELESVNFNRKIIAKTILTTKENYNKIVKPEI